MALHPKLRRDKYLRAMGILLALSTAAIPISARAAWVQSGPLAGLSTGHIWSVAYEPDSPLVAIAGTDNGVYRSTDGGTTWTETSVNVGPALAVGFDARDQSKVFAGIFGKGVRVSTDAGVTWSDSSAGLPTQNSTTGSARDVRAFAFGLDGIAIGTNAGVWLSDDGSTWRDGGLGAFHIAGIAVAANSPQFVLVAGVDGVGTGGDIGKGFLWRSNSKAQGWDDLQSGLPAEDPSKPTYVESVSSGPLPQNAQERPLFLNTNKGSYFSGDGGTTWTQSRVGPLQATPIAGTSQNPCEGVTITLTNATFSPTNPSLIYAGGDGFGSSCGELARSTDGGQTFVTDDTDLHAGLPNKNLRDVESIAVSSSQPPQLLAAINNPSGGGAIWQDTDNSAPAGSVATESSGHGLPTATATPAPTATPKPKPKPQNGFSFAGAAGTLIRWPFPLALELFGLLVVAYLIIRWRERKFDVEGPP